MSFKRSKELLFGLAFAGLLLIPCVVIGVLVHDWMLLYFWIWMIVSVLMAELVSVVVAKQHTGKSLTDSQRVWLFSKLYPKTAIAVLACWAVAFGMLIWHFGCKIRL